MAHVFFVNVLNSHGKALFTKMNTIKLRIGMLSRNTPQPNNYELKIGNLILWFSYETCIGFEYHSQLLNEKDIKIISKNEWTKTTGTHLNNLEPNQNARVPHTEMMSKLNELLIKKGLMLE